jgi:hypothetical protein
MERDHDWIVRTQWIGQAVSDLYIPAFGRERPEDAIVHDQDSAEILVQIAAVRRVVHAVMGRRVQEPFDRAQATDMLGVQELLVPKIDDQQGADNDRVKPGQRQRQKE